MFKKYIHFSSVLSFLIIVNNYFSHFKGNLSFEATSLESVVESVDL